MTDATTMHEAESHKIMSMGKNKRERVISASLSEFAKGYASANTDEIVKQAGISKGLLFHYFGSKKGLFLFLLEHAQRIANAKFETVPIESGDFINNIRIASKLSAEFSFEQPLVSAFLVKAIFSLQEVFPEGLPDDVPDFKSNIRLTRIMSYVDTSLFKTDIDIEKAKNIALWTMKGFNDKLLAHGSNIESYKIHYDQMMEELEGYLQLLRKLLYKN